MTELFKKLNELTEFKKRGSKYIGLCPIHEEKTPSLIYNEKDNSAYCFGCNKEIVLEDLK